MATLYEADTATNAASMQARIAKANATTSQILGLAGAVVPALFQGPQEVGNQGDRRSSSRTQDDASVKLPDAQNIETAAPGAGPAGHTGGIDCTCWWGDHAHW